MPVIAQSRMRDLRPYLRTSRPERCLSVFPVGIVCGRVDTQEIGRNAKIVGQPGGNDEKGALLSKSADEDPELQEYVVTGCKLLHVPYLNEILGSKNEDSEVHAANCLKQVIKRVAIQMENTLIPNSGFTVVTEFQLDRTSSL
jgi:hypothetical protein